MMHSRPVPSGARSHTAREALLSTYHVVAVAWTFLGAFVLPEKLLLLWIAQIALTFIGWIAFKGRCWVTKLEHRAKNDERYQSFTLKAIARTGIDVATHKDAITIALDSWHYLCVMVAFHRLGHIEYGAAFLVVWFVVNCGYRNQWNY